MGYSLQRLPLLFLASAALVTPPALAQQISFQDGVSGYSGTIDAEFRTDSVTTPLPTEAFISVDQEDGSTGDQNNRTQAALRFENIIGPGLIPTDEEILFAEVVLLQTSATAADAVISFNRILGEDTPDPSDPTPRGRTPGIWREDDTWFLLGGSVIPEVDPDSGFLILPTDPITTGDSTTLTFDNEAVNFDSPNLTQANPNDGRLADEFNLFDDAFVSIEVTEAVKAWQGGAINAGWAINNTTGNGWDFVSSDFSIASLPPEDQQGAQNLLDALGITEVEARPRLNVVVGVSGDLDFDGDIDSDDYDLLRPRLGNSLANRGETGDLDFDADVDLEDFARFKIAFDDANGGGAFAAMIGGVPEPSTAVLALVAACGLIRGRGARNC